MIDRLIPSMFARRLLLLGLLLFLAAALPVIQIFRLTVVKGDQLRAEAEQRLVAERPLPTHRGQILDRKGRILALDRPSYEVAVDYPVITGRWARTQAAKAARRSAGPNWATLAPEQREALITQMLPEYEARLEAMWSQFAYIAGLPREEIERRKDEIKLEVQTMAATVWARADRKAERERQRAEAMERGQELGADDPAPAESTPQPAAPAASAAPAQKRVRPAVREETIPHVVLRGVDDRTAFAFLRVTGEGAAAAPGDANGMTQLPGVHVLDGAAREYPLETIQVQVDRSSFPSPLRTAEPITVKVQGVATHVIGWMRDRIHAGDEERRLAEYRKRHAGAAEADSAEAQILRSDLGRYEAGDAVGATGIEASAEYDLRGLRGLIRTQLDTGAEATTPPAVGTDVHLALDIMLQARIQALFEPAVGLAVIQPWYSKDVQSSGLLGQRINGAAVVIDVDSGEVLAMVTAPTFTRSQLTSEPPGFLFPLNNKDDPDHPHPRPGLNRAIAKPYQPGSIVKPLMLCAATTNGNYQPEQRIPCTGYLLPNQPNMYQCWTWKQHHTNHNEILGHDLDGSDAIMGSCNIFFFELGRRMGPATLSDWYTRFGVGPRAIHPDLGLETETADGRSIPTLFGGSIGSIGGQGKGPSPSEAILMAIGQGPIAWTPLHAADAYATIARAGIRIPPRLRLDAANPPAPTPLGIDPRAIEQALSGLRRGVMDRNGTTNHLRIETPGEPASDEPIFNAPGVTVWAKSGTATARIVMRDLDGDGKDEKTYTDHAWVVCLVGTPDVPGGEPRPRYAIAVVADEAGSGGKASGPIANQIIHALIAEGYLPGARTGAGEPPSAQLQTPRAGPGEEHALAQRPHTAADEGE